MAFDNPSLFEILVSIRLKLLKELVIFLQQFCSLMFIFTSLLILSTVTVFILITSLCCLKVYCLQNGGRTNNKN